MTVPETSRVRVDIQVLRAVAVLAVIAGHFWPGRFPGGFTGVDVFFVISGYLITAHIVSEVTRTGRLKLVDFWMRRIRRILPAAVSVIAVVSVGVLWIGSPNQLDILGRHVIASSLSAENLLLAWDAVDYDHQDDTTSPLQHYWSLAVEEQFYLVWPLVVVGALGLTRVTRLPRERFRIVLLVAVGALTIGSFVYASSLDLTNPATYYDPFARAWELGVGAIVAVAGASGRWIARRSTHVAASAVAWLVIVAAVFVPGLNDSVPGVGVLASVLATAAVIVVAAPMTEFRVPVALRAVTALVWVGDRSYSAYLWHWPVLILTPFLIRQELTTAHKVVAIVAVFAISGLSYRFIEQPFRVSTSPLLRRPRFLAPIAASTTAIVIAGTLVGVGVGSTELAAADADQLVPTTSRTTPAPNGTAYPDVPAFCNGAGAAVFECSDSTAVLYRADTLPKFPPRTPTCVDSNDNGNFFDCRLGAVDAPQSIAIVGDSHAKALWVAWDDLGKRTNRSVHAFFTDGCPYMFERQGTCGATNESVRNQLISNDFDFVVLAQSVDRKQRIPDEIEQALFSATYKDLIDHNVNFVVLKDNPAIRQRERSCFERNFRNPQSCSIERVEALSVRDFAFETAATLAVKTMDFSDIYCDDATCPLAIGQVQVYRDYHHITTIFGKTLGPFIVSELVKQGFIFSD